MSYNWENTIWQSQDGSWNRGFYSRISHAPSGHYDDSEYDSEWDDDYDYDSFEIVCRGFSTEDAASRWQPYGNPGAHSAIPYRGNSARCKELDRLAHWFFYPEGKKKHERRELLRKNREHFKKLHSEWTAEAIRAALDGYGSYEVKIKHDEAAHTLLGLYSWESGRLRRNGDWLEIAGKRVYNLKTDKFDRHIHSFALAAPKLRW